MYNSPTPPPVRCWVCYEGEWILGRGEGGLYGLDREGGVDRMTEERDTDFTVTCVLF